MQKKRKTSVKAGTAKQSKTGIAASPNTPTSGVDILKSNLKNVGTGGLLGMLNQVKNVSPDQWRDPNTVKNMAKQFAEQLKIPVTEDRLNQFINVYKDATKGGEPNTDVESLVNKYGKGKVDQKTLNEMKKFIKPKK